MLTKRRRLWAGVSLLAIETVLVLLGCEDFPEPTRPEGCGLLDEDSGFQKDGLGLDGMLPGEYGPMPLQDAGTLGVQPFESGPPLEPPSGAGPSLRKRVEDRPRESNRTPGELSTATAVAVCIAGGTQVVIYVQAGNDIALVME